MAVAVCPVAAAEDTALDQWQQQMIVLEMILFSYVAFLTDLCLNMTS